MAATTLAQRNNTSSFRAASLQAHPLAAPGSPHTPKRAISTASAFSSPAGARDHDESMVFEFGSRFFRAGFSNETVPRCVLGYGPDEQRRVGDSRRWTECCETDWRKRKRGSGWGEAHELWSMDLRGADLGLVGDKIERVVRDAYQR